MALRKAHQDLPSADDVMRSVSEMEDPPRPDTVFLACSGIVGPNPDEIHRFIGGRAGFSRRQARNWGRRLRQQKIWDGRKIAANWLDKKTGGSAFWLDLAVMDGYLERTPA